MIAIFFPCCSLRIWLTSVVFPEPRKPATYKMAFLLVPLGGLEYDNVKLVVHEDGSD